MSTQYTKLSSPISALVAIVSAGMILSGCSVIVRPAPFHGARDQVTDASLEGPFDGQIVDDKTGEPLQDAIVVGVWSYDRGDGFIGPRGSETIEVVTDPAGRYRIPNAPLRIRGKSVRLVSFHLLVYKRGYGAYRSDDLLEGGPRRDFTSRHNAIVLRKWRSRDSHSEHLLFLAAPREIGRVARWEQNYANEDLYTALSGSPRHTELPSLIANENTEVAVAPREETLLSVSHLLPATEAIARTGFEGSFEIGDLTDLTRTYFYHGVHLKAVDHGEKYDIAFRVWERPAGGMQAILETIATTLPTADVNDDVTAETWVLDTDEVRAVGFIDREREVGVLLSCGAHQCPDIDTAIILAKYIHGQIENVGTRHNRPENVSNPLVPTTEPAPLPTPRSDAVIPAEADPAPQATAETPVETGPPSVPNSDLTP